MRRDPLAYAAMLVLATIWGYNWVVIKVATADADAFSVAAIRSLVGAACLFVALALTRRPLRPTPIGPTLALGLVQTTIFTLMQVLAIATGGAGKTAILAYTMPFWVIVLAWPVLHERVTRSGWLTLILAAAGLVLVLAPVTGSLLSEALAAGGAVVWAISTIGVKVLRARHRVDLLALTAWQMVYGTIPLVVLALVVPMHRLTLTPSFLAAIAYVAIPGTALAWLLWMFILSRLSAGAAGIASLLTPVIGMLSAWWQLGERPGPSELLGMCLILTALVVHAAPTLRSSRADPSGRGPGAADRAAEV